MYQVNLREIILRYVIFLVIGFLFGGLIFYNPPRYKVVNWTEGKEYECALTFPAIGDKWKCIIVEEFEIEVYL